MSEINLEFIAKQLANLIADQRSTRDEVRGLRLQIQTLRETVDLLREEVHIQGRTINRLDDTLRMNVLDRLQALEAARQP